MKSFMKRDRSEEEALRPKLIAKRDFIIVQHDGENEHKYEIKEGDDVSYLPEQFLKNLKTEEVI